MIAPNPFNPGSPVDPNDFVGRIQYLEEFKQKLRQTSEGSLASMSIIGGYGIGKTSFLHKCRAIAEEYETLPIYFNLNEMDILNKEMLARLLIARIQEKVKEEVILRKISSSIFDILKRIKIKTEQGIEVSISEDSTFPNLQSALTAVWKSLKGHKKAIVFFIDEARLLERNRAELMSYLRAVLEQLQLDKIPVMIIPAGKMTIVGPSGTGFSPLVRTFAPAQLENFSEEESRIFIQNKLNRIALSIKDETLDKIYKITEGHPFVLTSYLKSAYSKLKEGEKELKIEYFSATDIDFTNNILAPFFSRFYDHTKKNNHRMQILSKMATHPKGEISLQDLTEELKKDSYQLSPHLGNLVQDGAIIRMERGKYKLFHNLFGEYIKQKCQNND